MTEQIAGFDVERLHGPGEIFYAEDELVVVCLVRDGLPWVKSFVEHYSSLGVKHIVFLDNGSTDGTVEALTSYENVTVLRTGLPFMEHQTLMRRYLIGRFGKGRWCLCVDIDELFDYPYSDIIGLDSFLGYLSSKSYTAVAAPMLDMFPEHLSSNRTHERDEAWQEKHRFYDISEIERPKMSKLPKFSGLLRKNAFDSDEVAVAFLGGIRKTLFGFKPSLSKYPLLFSDGKSEHVGVHRVHNTRVADLTCVLFHYKFYAFSLQEYWYKAFNYKKERGQRTYEQYLEVLEKAPDLQLKLKTSREISSVNDLLENGLLVASEDYVGWVDAEEERSLSQGPLQCDPRALVKALVESRREARAKTLRVGRLERGLLELEQNKRAQGQKLQRSKRRQQRLTKKLGRLRRQLENVHASRAWAFVVALRRFKAKILAVRKR